MIRFRLVELMADRTFRERRPITLQEVAEQSGVHRATLSKLANQPGANVGSDVIDKLCIYFECQPGDLMIFVKEASELLTEEVDNKGDK